MSRQKYISIRILTDVILTEYQVDPLVKILADEFALQSLQIRENKNSKS